MCVIHQIRIIILTTDEPITMEAININDTACFILFCKIQYFDCLEFFIIPELDLFFFQCLQDIYWPLTDEVYPLL